MASSIYYRFRSARDYTAITFEGTGLSVWELKKEIIAASQLGKASDSDFALLDPETEQEYRNDNEIIPRATSVIARRLPARKPGHGTAANYVVTEGAASAAAAAQQSAYASGSRIYRGDMSRRFNVPEPEAPQPPKEALGLADAGMGELERIQAFQQMSKEQWEVDQEKMAHGKRLGPPRGGFGGGGRGGIGGGFGARPPAPNKPVPSGYICHRCDKPGHWIQDCPTNDDPNWEDKPRIKRTTGIPRSFLTAVDSRDAADNVMMTQDGTYVVARPDMASWEQHRAVAPNLSAADVANLEPTDPDLTCPIDNRLLRNAVLTPCCATAFCEDCLRAHMARHANACPECESRIKTAAALVADEDRRQRVAQYVDEMVRVSEEAAKTEDAERELVAAGGAPAMSPSPSAGPSTIESAGVGGPMMPGGLPARPAVIAPTAPPTPWEQELAKQQQLFQLIVLLANPKTPPAARLQCQHMLAAFGPHGFVPQGPGGGAFGGGGGAFGMPMGARPGMPPTGLMGAPTGPRGPAMGGRVNAFGLAPQPAGAYAGGLARTPNVIANGGAYMY